MLRRSALRACLHPDPKPDDTELFALLALWVPDRERRNRILVANPEVLYGFPDPPGFPHHP